VLLHRELIVALAARHRLPAVYPYRSHVMSGRLACYGPDSVDQFRRAAQYVDRILKGEKPADLPVQAPTKYELVINLKTTAYNRSPMCSRARTALSAGSITHGGSARRGWPINLNNGCCNLPRART
jgi:hypothetical protein